MKGSIIFIEYSICLSNNKTQKYHESNLSRMSKDLDLSLNFSL